MTRASNGLAAAAISALLLVGGCASEDEAVINQEPESRGFTWAGQGEPSNFGRDYNFCMKSVGVVRTSQFSQGVDGSVDAMSTQRTTSLRGDYATKRQFWVCMKSRGWQLVGAQ
jgi:hypothetical protein